jgi:hypothetical protein
MGSSPALLRGVTLVLLAAPACVCGLQPVEELRDRPLPLPPAGGDAGTDAGSVDAGPCVDDWREDNDSIADAGKPLYGIAPGPIVLADLVACPGDPDFIAAYSDCCDTTGVTVRWDAARGPLQVALIDKTGAPLAADVVEHDAGYTRLWRTKSGGAFYVEIHGSGAPYSAELLARVYGP